MQEIANPNLLFDPRIGGNVDGHDIVVGEVASVILREGTSGATICFRRKGDGQWYGPREDGILETDTAYIEPLLGWIREEADRLAAMEG